MRTVPPEVALRALPERASVIATPGSSTPETLLTALAHRSASAPGMSLSAGLLLGSFPFADEVRAGRLAYRTWHVWGPARALARDEALDYVPWRASDVPDGLADSYDAVLVRVSPPDAAGCCNLGPSLTYTRAALSRARTIIAEVDPSLPRTYGDTDLHLDDIDHLVDADTPMCEYPATPVTDVARTIGGLVAELIPRDATLQFGIGAIPAAVLEHLRGASLGEFQLVGMVSDPMVDLLRDARLGIGAVRAVELIGTQRVMAYADRNPVVRMVSSSIGHSVQALTERPRLVSVNSALCVDASGQVASDELAGIALAGVGGSVDFVDAARLSSGGVRVVALASTAPDGSSSIVRSLPAGTPVTIPRHGVDVVVTEHGVARLAGCSLRERAERLAAIAAPRFRDSVGSA